MINRIVQKSTQKYTSYILIVIINILFLAKTSAQNYYISNNGNDNNSGTEAKPWKTISKAASTVKEGATVYIREGTYHENIEPKYSGTADKKIVYTNYPNETVKIVGNSASEVIVKIRTSYITVKGLTLYHEKKPDCLGYADCPQSVIISIQYEDAHHNEILNNKIISPYPLVKLDTKVYMRETGMNVINGAHHNLIQGNEIRNMSKIGIHISQAAMYTKILDNKIIDIYQDCIHYGSGKGIITGTFIEGNILAGSVRSDGIQCNSKITENRGLIIRNNIMYDNAENNIDLKGTKHIIIEGNTLYRGIGDNDGGCKQNNYTAPGVFHDRFGGQGGIAHGGSSKSEDIIIRNNIVYDNNSGFGIGSLRWIIYNNTLVNNAYDYNGSNSTFTYARKASFSNILVAPEKQLLLNNIIGDSPQGEIRGHGTINSDYNLYFNTYKDVEFADFRDNNDWNIVDFNQWKNIINGDQHSIIGNPQFTNVPSRPVGDHTQFDFSLKSNSPAIDAGSFLTTAINNGSGKQIKVKDAHFFYDGFNITEGDLIQFEGQMQTARITEVNYNNNTLTVDTSLTWSSGLGLSLAYKGSAPDIGAFESERN